MVLLRLPLSREGFGKTGADQESDYETELSQNAMLPPSRSKASPKWASWTAGGYGIPRHDPDLNLPGHKAIGCSPRTARWRIC